jgi:N-methylhydantoinase A
MAARAQGTRRVFFDEVDEPVETRVYLRETLAPATVIEGPAIIEQLDSTTLVPPGVDAEVDEWLNVRINVAEGS